MSRLVSSKTLSKARRKLPQALSIHIRGQVFLRWV